MQPVPASAGEAARLRRDIAWNLAPVVLLAVVGLGLNFAIAAWWDAAALAVFTWVTTVVFAFAVIGACGIQFSVLRAVAEASGAGRERAGDVAGARLAFEQVVHRWGEAAPAAPELDDARRRLRAR